MKVVVFVKATASSEAGKLPSEKLMADMEKFNEELVAAGIMKTGDGLKPSSHGVRIRFSGSNRTVIDGPFAETKELVAGFWIWEVNSVQEAIEWVKRCPNPMPEDSEIEIRPCYSIEDFAELDPTGEFAAKEKELAATIENMSADEAEIRHMMHQWSRALEAKDVEGLVKDYAPDAVLFDAIPPYKVIGAENIRQVWANCLPFFPDQFKSEHRDIQVHVVGDTAFAHCLHHFIPTPPDHPCGQTWMRVTVGYRKLHGNWKVVHEHVSVPFNPMNSQAWFIADPNKIDMPDYGAGSCATRG